MMEDIYIVFASDNGYAQHLSVSIASLLKNSSPEDTINIFVLDGGISEENKDKIESLKSIRPFQIYFTSVDPSIFSHAPIQKTHTVGGKVYKSFNSSAYNRLLIAEQYSNLDKIIYLDSDIIVQGNIASLWKEECAGYAIGAVETPIWPDEFEQRLNALTLTNKSPYFNSGVMLMNLKVLREILPVQKSLDIIREYGGSFICHDQDVLNIALKERWKPIEAKYNVLPQMLELEKCKGFHSYSIDEINTSLLSPVVAHFAKRPKPWHFGCLDPRKKEYFYYLKLTEFDGYKMPNPSLKERVAFYKANTKIFIGKRLPYLFKALKKIKSLVK